MTAPPLRESFRGSCPACRQHGWLIPRLRHGVTRWACADCTVWDGRW